MSIHKVCKYLRQTVNAKSNRKWMPIEFSYQ